MSNTYQVQLADQYFSCGWWGHQSRTKLKGDKNADIYINKVTKGVFLKGNKSDVWVPTGQKLD